MSYFAQRMLIGVFFNFVRWGLVGRRPVLDTPADVVKFLLDSASRGDAPLVGMLGEMVTEYSYNQNYSFLDNMASFGGKALGPGTMAVAREAYFLQKAATTEDEEALYYLRKAFPYADWIPADLIVNRLILDNLYTYTDPEGAYTNFRKSIEANLKSRFRYYIDPGSTTMDHHRIREDVENDLASRKTLSQEQKDAAKQRRKDRQREKARKQLEDRRR
jgi:hypothetical protein